MKVCERIRPFILMCFDTDTVADILANCMSSGSTIDECLTRTGWVFYKDLLVKYNVINEALARASSLKS